ncbi:MAG: hypothetical protein M3N12_04550 [Verrucomicrobiota bacterium]|nr:hypothetical protein [Verrucomicrobiota bacterium]
MSASPAVVITTRLPPLICGIGAYSWLAHKHRPNESLPAEFLVMEGAADSRAQLGYEAITDFNGDPEALTTALRRAGAASIILHYAGRAYQRFGCPTWLPGALRKWKTEFPGGRLTVFFHEVPGETPRLSRHFLLGKINSRIIRQLSALADVVVTNTEHHADVLRKLSGRDDVHRLPVGSNIEVANSPRETRVETEFMIFGLPFGRWQTLQSFGPEIRRWRESGVLTKLHLVGPDDDKLATEGNSMLEDLSDIVVRHGMLPEFEVSRWLAHAWFALTNVSVATWSKSGAFMACAAHGCAVVIKQERTEIPLCYAVAAKEVGHVSAAEINARTAALRNWYHENADWSVTARRLSDLAST